MSSDRPSRMDDLDVSLASSTCSSLSPLSPSSDEVPQVVGGLLNLSAKNYSKLPKKFERIYSTVVVLDVSHNRFKFVNLLALFTQLTEVNASYNLLERLAAFLSVSKTLRILNVSHNEIVNIDALPSLPLLTHFSGAHNRILSVPLLDRLGNLSSLDLSFNNLSSLPRFVRMRRLSALNLSGNKIRLLEDSSQCLPTTLRDLDISDNLICDLRQALYLSCLSELESLTFGDNPCVRCEGRTFDYRPFLFSCLPAPLRYVDRCPITEVEILKGERLQTQGKFRRFQCHADLSSYLTRECPLAVFSDGESGVMSPLDDEILKVLKKRREMLGTSESSETNSEASVFSPSPYSEWLRGSGRKPTRKSASFPSLISREEHKENCPPTLNLTNVNDIPLGSGSSTEVIPLSAASTSSTSTVILSRDDRLPTATSVVSEVKKVGEGSEVEEMSRMSPPPSSQLSSITPKSAVTVVARNPLCQREERNISEAENVDEGSQADEMSQMSPPPSSQLSFVTPLSATPVAARTPLRQREERLSMVSALNCSSKVNQDRVQELPVPISQTPLSTRQSRPSPAPRLCLSTPKAAKLRMEESRMETVSKKEVDAVRTLQYWWRGVQIARLRDRVKVCEERDSKMLETIDELCEQCAQLSMINKEKEDTILQLTTFVTSLAKKTESVLAELNIESRLSSVESRLSSILPVPSSLNFTRISPSSGTVEWINEFPVQPDGYSIMVDGKSCGQVKAKWKKVMVTDLDPTRNSEISIQCVMSDGTVGPKSKVCTVGPYSEEAPVSGDREPPVEPVGGAGACTPLKDEDDVNGQNAS